MLFFNGKRSIGLQDLRTMQGIFMNIRDNSNLLPAPRATRDQYGVLHSWTESQTEHTTTEKLSKMDHLCP